MAPKPSRNNPGGAGVESGGRSGGGNGGAGRGGGRGGGRNNRKNQANNAAVAAAAPAVVLADEIEDDPEDNDDGDDDEDDGINVERNQGDDSALADVDDDDDDGDDGEGDLNADGIEVDPLAHLPDYVLKRVGKLKELDDQREEMMKQYISERATLEKKFEQMWKPLYDERAAIVKGEKDEMIANENPTSTTASDDDGADGERRIVGIPQFWVCTMTQTDTIGEMITEEDVDCLEYLLDITCENREDGKGFTLRFHFAANDYFSNSVLTKEYEVPNLLFSDEPILKNVVGTTINWKSDRSLTHRTIKKKQRGKGKHAGQVRTVTKTEEKESFFHWFSPPEMPSMDDMDEEEADHLEELFDSDYEVADAFRSIVIPRAVRWFSGQANQQEMDEAVQGSMEGMNN